MTVGRDTSAPLRRAEAKSGLAQSPNQFDARHLDGASGDQAIAVLLGHVVVVPLKSSPRDPVGLGETMELIERGVAHQVAPAPFTEPPVRTVDVESQRRRSGRTRTGMGFGRAPSTRAPTPIPTAVATMVTIQEATISTYSSARSMTWRTRKSRANTVDLSVHS